MAKHCEAIQRRPKKYRRWRRLRLFWCYFRLTPSVPSISFTFAVASISVYGRSAQFSFDSRIFDGYARKRTRASGGKNLLASGEYIEINDLSTYTDTCLHYYYHCEKETLIHFRFSLTVYAAALYAFPLHFSVSPKSVLSRRWLKPTLVACVQHSKTTQTLAHQTGEKRTNTGPNEKERGAMYGCLKGRWILTKFSRSHRKSRNHTQRVLPKS